MKKPPLQGRQFLEISVAISVSPLFVWPKIFQTIERRGDHLFCVRSLCYYDYSMAGAVSQDEILMEE